MKKIFSLLFLFAFIITGFSQSKKKEDLWESDAFKGLKFRSIGPALMSGRIADIAINPNDESQWYVAVGSGGVWKTNNAGNTWMPIFDNEACYSTGCITIDPNNDDVIWLGTGENVGGRHVSYGCGIYKSQDGGKTWKNMGLNNSEHLSRIIIHPDDSNTIWVASQGPLWNKGGERGIYKTTDGGNSWKRVLGDDMWVGATEIVIDPTNPDKLYAATWQRQRTIAAYMGGGPGSGLHRSDDGGETWDKLTNGIPTSNLGKIGLAISPQQPNVLYAAIELDRKKGGVFKSVDSGSSWTKMSDAVSGATGPHYYQELYASPHQFDRLYLMDVRVQVSDNGGKTFRRLKEKDKHSDNHAIAFKMSDPDYILMGTDGGMYESFDLAENWRFFPNLPLTQFYKIAVDDAEPFYNVYGGTQDNSTEAGPSRTDNVQGIDNGDWKVVLNWDGHQPATEPGNPNIVYGQRQQGTLSRIDMQTGEVTDIQPQPGKGEGFERFNWDAPILVSPHDPKQIYFASQRLWRSDNRGDNWTAISEDLTRNQNRLELPIMGRVQSYDNPWDVDAMSTFNTITSIAESPVQRDLLYIGTDDGLIHVTTDGGATWTKKEVSTLPGVPSGAYVNDIKADLFDPNVVYIALDNHKEGDYKPYIYKSTNQGKTWSAISSNLPEKDLVWRIVQDHVNKDLLFIGTEFGIYFTINGGQKWIKCKGGLPTISFRDLTIHRRDNDLICGSFGRSIYIFDDINVFRNLSQSQMESKAALVDAGEGLWYIPRPSLAFGPGNGSQGAGYFMAENPPFGSVFTYYLKEGLKTKAEQRKEREEDAKKTTEDVPWPGWDTLDGEFADEKDKVWLTVRDEGGQVVRVIEGPAASGFHRVAWDLRYPAADLIELNPRSRGEWDSEPAGMMVAPGTYTVEMSIVVDGETTYQSEPRTFEVVPLRSNSLKGGNINEVTEFWDLYEQTTQLVGATSSKLSHATKKTKAIGKALSRSQIEMSGITETYEALTQKVAALNKQMYGSPARNDIGEKTNPTIGNRLFAVNRGITQSTYGPTATHRENIVIIQEEIGMIQGLLDEVGSTIKSLSKQIYEAGGPMIEGVEY
ncbi:MAG: glycosyl hydrolase [Bacteroidota bacterium]